VRGGLKNHFHFLATGRVSLYLMRTRYILMQRVASTETTDTSARGQSILAAHIPSEARVIPCSGYSPP